MENIKTQLAKSELGEIIELRRIGAAAAARLYSKYASDNTYRAHTYICSIMFGNHCEIWCD